MAAIVPEKASASDRGGDTKISVGLLKIVRVANRPSGLARLSMIVLVLNGPRSCKNCLKRSRMPRLQRHELTASESSSVGYCVHENYYHLSLCKHEKHHQSHQTHQGVCKKCPECAYRFHSWVITAPLSTFQTNIGESGDYDCHILPLSIT